MGLLSFIGLISDATFTVVAADIRGGGGVGVTFPLPRLRNATCMSAIHQGSDRHRPRTQAQIFAYNSYTSVLCLDIGL